MPFIFPSMEIHCKDGSRRVVHSPEEYTAVTADATWAEKPWPKEPAMVEPEKEPPFIDPDPPYVKDFYKQGKR